MFFLQIRCYDFKLSIGLKHETAHKTLLVFDVVVIKRFRSTSTRPGVDFTNILQAALMSKDPKSAKRH